MNLTAGDFTIVPTVIGDDDCRIEITHKWTGKKWHWKGPESDWATAGPNLSAQIMEDLAQYFGTVPGKVIVVTSEAPT